MTDFTLTSPAIAARVVWAAALLLTASSLGCQRGPAVRCHPVRGRVTQGGKPVAEAAVVLHPLGAQLPENVPHPLAYTQADGAFTLTTLQREDGAPAGEYAVTVVLKQARLVGEELVRDGKSLLPAEFSEPATTPLRCTVLPGDNQLPPFDLSVVSRSPPPSSLAPAVR